MRKIVVKFGGSALADGDRVKLAARSVYEEYKKGAKIVAVASAMGESTDELIKVANACTDGRISASELDGIMATGEQVAVRILAAALNSQGVRARYIDPLHEDWPIITDSNFGNADVDAEETRRRVRERIAPLLEGGVVPVVCGFVGRDAEGRITTMGRGGSDLTAFLLASCLDADEVIFVKDVEGVMSCDPDKIKGAKLIEHIAVEEMRDLARFGAAVLHPRALDFKSPGIGVKVIHFRHGDLSAKGTAIVGPKGRAAEVWAHEEPVAMLTIIGEGMQTTPGILAEASKPLAEAGINILGISVGPRSLSLFIAEDDSQRALELLHEVVVRHGSMKSVTSEGNMAMITAESGKFIETPGVITKLTEPLGRAGINIIETFSSRATITFFVNWAYRERALELLKEAMKGI